MEYVCRLGHMDENVLSSIHEYVRSVVLPYVEENCGSEDAFDSFLKIVKENIHLLSGSYFKQEVSIAVEGMRVTYVAMVVDSVLKELESLNVKIPSYASIFKSIQLKRAPGLVEMNRNVNFAGTVRRCTIIRQHLFSQNFDTGLYI